MKVNRAERWVVNSPVRILVQRYLIRWFKGKTVLEPGARILEIPKVWVLGVAEKGK